jgi:hypothetical protein
MIRLRGDKRGFPARSFLDPLVVAHRRRHSSLHVIESPPARAGPILGGS